MTAPTRQRAEQLREIPVDLRELDAERERLEVELRRRAEALGQAQAQLRQREGLEGELAALVTELAKLDLEVAGPAASYDAARHEAVRVQLAQLDPLRRERDQAVGLAARAQALGAEAEAAEGRATIVEAELAAVDARLAALAWDPEAFARIERDVRAAQSALAEVRVTLARTAANVEGAERLRGAARPFARIAPQRRTFAASATRWTCITSSTGRSVISGPSSPCGCGRSCRITPRPCSTTSRPADMPSWSSMSSTSRRLSRMERSSR